MISHKKNNILWIVIDALRFDHLSCYGHNRRTTPHIDNLAEEGILFERAYSTACWSLPSHASMFTGLYPSKHGADDEHHYLTNRYATLAEVLKNAGYQTALFNNNPWVGPDFGLARGFGFVQSDIIRDRNPRRFFRRVIQKAKKILTNTNTGAAVMTKYALKWFDEYVKTQESPFFTFIHYNEPHRPYRFNRILRRKFKDGISAWQASRINQDHDAYIAGAARMTERDFFGLKTIYDSEIYHADDYIGQLFVYLKERGILDDTIVIVTADHGENFGEHSLMDHKLCLYETLIHVPLIIRYPKEFAPGTRSQSLVQHVDLFPTLLDILDIEAPDVRKELQGYSLVEKHGNQRSFIIAENSYPNLIDTKKYPTFDTARHNRRLKVVRNAQHNKYIWASDGKHELYNLEKDPAELDNLIDQSADLAIALQETLDKWLATFQVYEPEGDVHKVDPAVRERLADLGYME